MIDEQNNAPMRFAICVDTDDPDLLTPRMIYRVLPDENAARSSFLRVIDNEEEDYLYPSAYFVLVDFPQPVQQALLRTKVPPMRRVESDRST